MSRLIELLRELRIREPILARDLDLEVSALMNRREFGLNFERHVPEAIELPGRKVRKGDKVRILPPRGENLKVKNQKLWRVIDIKRSNNEVKIEPIGEKQFPASDKKTDFSDAIATVSLSDLVVICEFRDSIYPGIISTGKIEKKSEKPFHAVINSENFHALQTLLFTHRGKIDCIYIDPPYNTGAKDWKYNNDYVESDDLYRHSKWLAMIERRLLVSKELLNPNDSVLIITIDEKEYLRLGLLLEQIFPDGRIQMITSVINPRAGVSRPGTFTRIEEYIFIVQFGASAVKIAPLSGDILPEKNTAPIWFSLMRTGSNSARQDRPNLFYPIWVKPNGELHSIGNSVPLSTNRNSILAPDENLIGVWPIRPDGSENTWQLGPSSVQTAFKDGTARINSSGAKFTINYLRTAEKKRIADGEIEILGRESSGALQLRHREGAIRLTRPKTVWSSPAHDAGLYGSQLLNTFIRGRKFPFPKSLYAVEDTLRFFLCDKPSAIVLDFFAGSGTTAHAVMRLNNQDSGNRKSISITNNEVAADEQAALREKGFRPGDPEWEKLGICEYITKPRIEAAVIGKTPDGQPVSGEYKFMDEFSMSVGFDENVEFFTLTYEAPLRVASNREFTKIAPLLWMRAGSIGRRIEDIAGGWDITDFYGVLADIDHADKFLKAVFQKDNISTVYIITDEDRVFESISQELPEKVESVRLYEAYLRNFEIESGRGSI